MIQAIAFVTYPVSDLNVARAFYEGVLGLRLSRESGDEWFEYDVGDTTFAITTADAEHPAPIRGAVVAFEMSDLDSEVTRLRQRGVTFRRDITETPVCRFAVVQDPDGNEIILHRRNT